MSEVLRENQTLRQQLEESKQLMDSLTSQIQEVMTVNHAVAVQIEQAASVRKYLGGVNGELNSSVSEVNGLITEISENSGAGGSEGMSASTSEVLHKELKSLHDKNLDLERQYTDLNKVQAKQRTHIIKQDRWVKQLSNVVASLSQKLEEKGEGLQSLVQSQIRTTKQLHDSENTLQQLSQVNRELFSKLKHALAASGAGGRGPEGGDMVQKILGENLQLKADLSMAREKLKTAIESGADAKELASMRAENDELRARFERVEKLRKATNQRAHKLAQEKQALTGRVQVQQNTIQSLRRQLATGGDSTKMPKWKGNF